jgi:hypothetical protein
MGQRQSTCRWIKYDFTSGSAASWIKEKPFTFFMNSVFPSCE